jgi:hypothetical protein
MPTWLWFFLVLFSVTAIIAFLMSPPEAVMNWFVSKFEIHPELRAEDVEVSVNGKHLDGEDKQQFIVDWNNATFMDRYYDQIPNFNGLPAQVTVRQGKHVIRINLSIYRDHVDVVKQRAKKVTAYRLLARNLQHRLLEAYSRDLMVENEGLRNG